MRKQARYGINTGTWYASWQSQQRVPSAQTFEDYLIDDNLSEAHPLTLVDLNGDGRLDIVTGKRFFAHEGDPLIRTQRRKTKVRIDAAMRTEDRSSGVAVICNETLVIKHLTQRRATPGFGGDLRPFGRTRKKPQVFRKRRGSPALRFFPVSHAPVCG